MSGGSQHNPNGRQSHSPAWNHLQVPGFLARTPQVAHMSSERSGVTWHTPTPPHHYHAPAPASPDPLQVAMLVRENLDKIVQNNLTHELAARHAREHKVGMKVTGASGNSVFRHTATPPERDALLYRHSPTPPDMHFRHTPSPGDVKATAGIPPPELFPHLTQPRDKLRADDILAYARSGVDLSVGRPTPPPSNGSPAPLSLSVRDPPAINSLLARAQPRPAHARVDSLLERLAPAPISPHSVIMHSRVAPTPSPPGSSEDSADSCGAPPGAKRKRKPERTIRVPVPPPMTPPAHEVPTVPAERLPSPPPVQSTEPTNNSPESRVSALIQPEPNSKPFENGENPHTQTNGPSSPAKPEVQHTRRKTRSGSAETIDDIAAMIASTDKSKLEGPSSPPPNDETLPSEPPATVEVLHSVLSSPDAKKSEVNPVQAVVASNPEKEEPAEGPVAPKRRATRSSNSETTNVPVESPSEAKPAETDVPMEGTSEPASTSFVEVEKQLENMFAGLEEEGPNSGDTSGNPVEKKVTKRPGKKRSRSSRTPAKKGSRRPSVAVSNADDDAGKTRKKVGPKQEKSRPKEAPIRDAYDSGSNASSGRSRGPFVQIRGPRDSPISVSVVNAATAPEDDCDGPPRPRPPRRKVPEGDFRNGLKTRGLHCSTLSARYDATTPDASWVCVFCELGPHAGVSEKQDGRTKPLGDLFGPYTVTTDCEEFKALDEARRRKYSEESLEVWFHEECAVWAPGLVAAGSRLSGLESAVWMSKGARCGRCGRSGAGVACVVRGCPARAHVNCARSALWRLDEQDFRAFCHRHA